MIETPVTFSCVNNILKCSHEPVFEDVLVVNRFGLTKGCVLWNISRVDIFVLDRAVVFFVSSDI